MPEISIDGKSYQVEEGKNLLEVCQALGLELPYFCWHPALGSVGSCRQCAVTLYHNEDDTRGRITMACMTPVAEGQRLSLKDPKVEKFRSLLIEATMTNHPHDCPVCEEAGECHLQDMTLKSGHINRRYKGPKRTHRNQYLGPFINHEMNRCIGCYRCVRFYRDYCGGTDLNVFASRNNIYFGRAEEGNLENEFSGNLAEVCPTGVFTDKTFSQHFSRKWDLQSAPSICVHCSVGCNIYPGERNGTLRRITNRFNPDVNGHFICDRGRFAYDFVNHNERLTVAWERNYETKSTDQLTQENAQTALKQLLNDQKNASQENSVVAIGSSRSSLENNFTLRAMVGENNFYSDAKELEQNQMKSLLQHYQNVQQSNSLKELEGGDVALIVGEDITQTAPRIALSIRQMTKNAGKCKAANIGVQYWSAAEVKNIAQDLKSPLHIVAAHSTHLDDAACTTFQRDQRDQIDLIKRITCYINISINTNISISISISIENEEPSNDIDQHAKQIANDLRLAKKPFIITGTNLGQCELFDVTLKLSESLHHLNNNSGFICALSQANSIGLSLITNRQNHLDSALERLELNPPDSLVILETDLYRKCEPERLEALFNKVKNIIVLDHLMTRTAEQADLLLPTTSFAESHGSWVNYEGRLQSSIACFPANNHRRPAHQWLSNGTQFHSLINDLAGLLDCFKELPSLYPPKSSDFNLARKSVRNTGRTSLNSYIDIKEIPPDTDASSPYQFSQEGLACNAIRSVMPAATTPANIWAPGWNSSEALSHFQDDVNGSINGTHPGILLFKDLAKHTDYTKDIDVQAKINTPPEGALYILPYHHIFSEDELGGYVSNIQKQSPAPCVRLNSHQAKIMGFQIDDVLVISFITSFESADHKVDKTSLPLSLDDSIPNGVALLPALLLQSISLIQNTFIYLKSGLENSNA